MVEQVKKGEARAKFKMNWLGASSHDDYTTQKTLAAALDEMWQLGCCPVLEDGFLTGNGASLLASGSLLVSPSARLPQAIDPLDLVEVVGFDTDAWSCSYRSAHASLQPTSDTPLYWAALVQAPKQFAWPEAPKASLHGHLLSTEAEAHALELPISNKETLFSTPEDRHELMSLLETHPYPRHRCVVRRGHGFFILQPDIQSAAVSLRELARKAGVVPND